MNDHRSCVSNCKEEAEAEVSTEFRPKTSELPTCEEIVPFRRTQKTHKVLGSELEQNFSHRQTRPIAEEKK